MGRIGVTRCLSPGPVNSEAHDGRPRGTHRAYGSADRGSGGSGGSAGSGGGGAGDGAGAVGTGPEASPRASQPPAPTASSSPIAGARPALTRFRTTRIRNARSPSGSSRTSPCCHHTGRIQGPKDHRSSPMIGICWCAPLGGNRTPEHCRTPGDPAGARSGADRGQPGATVNHRMDDRRCPRGACRDRPAAGHRPLPVTTREEANIRAHGCTERYR